MHDIKEEDSFYHKKETDEDHSNLSSKVECQSDIIIGWHDKKGNSTWDHLSEDERKTNSDIHEMFFVNELLHDDKKFNKLLRRI